MNFSKLHFLAIAAMAALPVSGCMENMKENAPDLSEDGIEFSIEVSEPTDKGASSPTTAATRTHGTLSHTTM